VALIKTTKGGLEAENDVDQNPLIGSRSKYDSQYAALKERYKVYLDASMRAKIHKGVASD
jgi:hypothetical protein